MWEPLYADNLVAVADSLEQCIAKLKAWKEGMDYKGLRVHMKTKLMVSGPGLDLLRDAGVFPCKNQQSQTGNHFPCHMQMLGIEPMPLVNSKDLEFTCK